MEPEKFLALGGCMALICKTTSNGKTTCKPYSLKKVDDAKAKSPQAVPTAIPFPTLAST